MPFYPSYYPQGIVIEAMDAAQAAAELTRGQLHGYLGDAFPDTAPPPDVTVWESLGSFLVITANPASEALATPSARCTAARALAASLPPGSWVYHPYPVTPYHADYLQHADIADALRNQLPRTAARPPGLRVIARGPVAEQLVGAAAGSGDAWDLVVEEVTIGDLLASRRHMLNGWLGPPWVKEGWFQAHSMLAGSIRDPARRRSVDEAVQRLTGGRVDRPAARLTLERTLLRDLQSGCERLVAGYALRREHLNVEYSSGVENIAWDAQAGLNAPIFIRTVKLKDFPWNGWLRLGVPGPPAAAWNPIAGFTDPAGRLVWWALGDPGLFPEPYNATWTENRVRLDRAPERAGEEPIPVPADALRAEAGTGILRPVGEGRTAAARITYRVLTSAFHDGTRTEPADLLYGIAFAFRWGARGAAEPDPDIARATALLRDWLVGVKVLRVVTDVLRFGEVEMKYRVPVVEIYLSRSIPDPGQLGAVSPPWSTVPWHGLALMEEAVGRGVAAFSAGEARRQGVPWLDLVRDPKQREQLLSLLDDLLRRSHVPEPLRGLVSPAQARERWAALRKFAAEKRHLLVTNGPYLVNAGAADSAVLGVFRDFSYPLGVGSYDRYPIPVRAYVARAEVRGNQIEVSARLERVERFGREHEIKAGPFGPGWEREDKDSHPVCRYVVVGHDGAVQAAGAVDPAPAGTFTLTLPEGPRPRTVLIGLPVKGNLVNLPIETVRVP